MYSKERLRDIEVFERFLGVDDYLDSFTPLFPDKGDGGEQVIEYTIEYDLEKGTLDIVEPSEEMR